MLKCMFIVLTKVKWQRNYVALRKACENIQVARAVRALMTLRAKQESHNFVARVRSGLIAQESRNM